MASPSVEGVVDGVVKMEESKESTTSSVLPVPEETADDDAATKNDETEKAATPPPPAVAATGSRFFSRIGSIGDNATANLILSRAQKLRDQAVSEVDRLRHQQQQTQQQSEESNDQVDNAYYLMKSKLLQGQTVRLPSWTGFNAALQKSIPIQSRITYLPVIDASATDMSAINTMLLRSVEIMQHLNLHQIVVVADQAIYAKGQEIRLASEDFKQKIVLRLGAFHTAMAFMSVIG